MSQREVGVLPRDTREQLVATAAREFAQASYERASLNRVLRSCGMSKSSFYHFLGSKEALFDLVVGDGAAELLRLLEVPAPDRFAGDFWEEAGRLLDRLAGLAGAPPWLTDVGRLFYLEDAPRGAGSVLGAAEHAVDAWMTDVIAVGRREGALRTDLPESLQVDLVLAVLRAMDRWALRHPSAATQEEVILASVGAIRRLLAPG